jgi:hypothetical protein
MGIGEKSEVVIHVEKGFIVDSENKYVDGCLWQKHYNEIVGVKFQLLSW